MNKQIERLSGESQLAELLHNFINPPVKINGKWVDVNEIVSKFGELIVKDCLEIIEAQKISWRDTPLPPEVVLDLTSKNIAAYFGVEHEQTNEDISILADEAVSLSREEIIRMAQQCFTEVFFTHEVEEFAERIAAAEREACEVAVSKVKMPYEKCASSAHAADCTIVEAIRAIRARRNGGDK